MHAPSALLLAAVLVSAEAAADPLQGRMERALLDVETLPAELHAAINEQRLGAELDPLSIEPALQRAAAEEALSLVALLENGQPIEASADRSRLARRLAGLSYEPHAFIASIALNHKSVPGVVSDLMGDALNQGDLWRDDLPDIGIGTAEFEWSMVYVVVLGRTVEDEFGARTSGLADRDQVRATQTAEVNAARVVAKRPGLEQNACLDQVAQAYAERMLREGFFSHEAPGREDVQARVRKGRCPHRPVGENLALGPESPEVVVEEWLASRSHRRTLLDPNFTEMGLGLALGRGPDGYRIIWVQVLGRRVEG